MCIYKCGGRTHLAKHAIFTVLKRHANCRDVIYQQGKDIKITSAVETIKTEIDGDPGPALPLRISVMPRAVKCVVPPGAHPAGIRARIIRALR